MVLTNAWGLVRDDELLQMIVSWLLLEMLVIGGVDVVAILVLMLATRSCLDEVDVDDVDEAKRYGGDGDNGRAAGVALTSCALLRVCG